MRVIERSDYRDEEGAISLENRVSGTLKFGLQWYGEMQALDTATQRLSKTLGSEHVLIRSLTLPGTELIVPLTLISPQGVRVIMPTALRGIFRAKGDEWLTFDGRARRFKRTRPNLQHEVSEMAQAVHSYLRGQGFPLPEVEAVLIFTSPRTHVDTARPTTRIVLADAIDHFAANLQQFQPIMDRDDIDALVHTLTKPSVQEAKASKPPEFVDAIEPGILQALEEEDDLAALDPFELQEGTFDLGHEVAEGPPELDFDAPIAQSPFGEQMLREELTGETFLEEGFDEEPLRVEEEDDLFQVEALSSLRPPAGETRREIAGLRLTKQQWIVLGVLGLVELFILIAFALLILTNAVFA